MKRLSPPRSRSSESGYGFPVAQKIVSVSRSYEPVSHVAPPPNVKALPCQVSKPGSPFAGTVQRRHTRSPLEAL